MDAAVSVRNDAVTTGEYYRYAAPYREAGDDSSPEPETESGAFYARLHHERELNDRTQEPISNIRYELTSPTGSVLKGVSCEKGLTSFISHSKEADIELTILKQDSLYIG